MSTLRVLIVAGLLAFTTVSVAPAVAASIDNVYFCVYKVAGTCAPGNAAEAHVKGKDLEACVVGVAGSCQPYNGDLVRVTYEDQEFSVPDPCYTTACF